VRAGSDIAFLAGVINYLLSNEKLQHDTFEINERLVHRREDYRSTMPFSGYDPAKHRYDPSSWATRLDAKGYAKVDPTFEQHAACCRS